MFDIDHFKSFNDNYGLLIGYEVIKRVSGAMMNIARENDFPARYGGEELALVLPRTDEAGAYEVAEKIRLAVAALTLPQESSPVADVVTVSFGCGAMVPTHESSMEEFVKTVDAALYKAKQQGRNRTVLIRTGQ